MRKADSAEAYGLASSGNKTLQAQNRLRRVVMAFPAVVVGMPVTLCL